MQRRRAAARQAEADRPTKVRGERCYAQVREPVRKPEAPRLVGAFTRVFGLSPTIIAATIDNQRDHEVVERIAGREEFCERYNQAPERGYTVVPHWRRHPGIRV